MLNIRNTLIAAAILALGASAWAQGGTGGALKPTAPPAPASAAAMPATPAPAADKMMKKDHDKTAVKKTEKKHAKKKDHTMKKTTHQPAAKPAQ